MKIIALTENLNDITANPAPFILLPETALLQPTAGSGKDKPLFLPDFDTRIRLFPSLAIRISRLGKGIPERFAHRYYDAWSICLQGRGMNTLQKLRQAGMPWGAACSFDGAFITGEWQHTPLPGTVTASDGTNVITIHANVIQAEIDRTISYLSDTIMLKQGDIIALHGGNESLEAKIGKVFSAEGDGVKVLYLRVK